MKQDKVNVKIVPDNRRSKTDKRFPLKLRLTYKGDRRYYGTGYHASLEEWDIINSAEAKGNLRKIKNSIATIEDNAQKCCDDIFPFSFKQFENEFFQKKIKYENLESAFTDYIRELKSFDQYGTATNYQTAYNSLNKFKNKLVFEDITKDFLYKYENWLLDHGKSITTVGIYVRNLRTIMNVAKENGIIRPEAYPFGKRKYIIPTGKNTKKALGIEQIKEIFDYKVISNTAIDKARDIWILSYLCNGINMMDIANLRWKNLGKDTISFIREKTKRATKGNPIIITVIRNQYIDKILKKWGKEYTSADDFIFGVINKNDSVELARKKVQQFTHLNNKWTKRIGVDLGFEIKLTTYVARHSFATILLRNGAPMTFASQSLGHSNIITTQKYFAGFDLRAQAEYTKALTDFERASDKLIVGDHMKL